MFVQAYSFTSKTIAKALVDAHKRGVTVEAVLDKPEERHSVMIVDTESNPRLHLINENTPRALAFLNAVVGDEVEMEIKGNSNKFLRVVKIQRQERMFK